jgi:hypothetical protein
LPTSLPGGPFRALEPFLKFDILLI